MSKETKFEILPNFKGIEIKLNESGLSLMPRRSTQHSAGYDFRSSEDIVINPNERKLVSTGVTASMPDNVELQVRCRSSLAVKGLMLANGVGTIDSDYYGNEIKFIYYNASDKPFTINKGDKIGQGVFSEFLKTVNDDPADKVRSGGFGSTGIK